MSDMSDHYDAALERLLLAQTNLDETARETGAERAAVQAAIASAHAQMATHALMEQIYKELSSIKTLLQNHK